MRIGVFGGTFNPVHYGHLRAAEEVGERLGLDRILFVPSGNPPLKTEDIAEASHRYAMVSLAIGDNLLFEALDIECASSAKSYTVTTVESLLKRYDGSQLFLILGVDAFVDIPNWWQPDKLVSIVNFVVISRPGRRFSDLLLSPYLKVSEGLLKKLDDGEAEATSAKLITGREISLVRVTRMDISSTEIRRRLKERLSIKYLLPHEVESFIISHKLYNIK